MGNGEDCGGEGDYRERGRKEETEICKYVLTYCLCYSRCCDQIPGRCANNARGVVVDDGGWMMVEEWW